LNDFDDAKKRICGTNNENPTILAGVSQAFNEEMCLVADLLRQVRTLFQCATWYPLYETTVYDTLCYSVPSFSWIASTQLVVVFMAMVILTFRVVLSQPEAAQSSKPGLETVDDHKAQEIENGEVNSYSQSSDYSA
jgi:hypothetical protein